MIVSVLGLGYIGLPTAVMFASHGIQVYGMEPKEEICNKLNLGEATFEEGALAGLLKQAVNKGMLRCDTVLKPADVYIIAVPTPIYENKRADVSYVEQATKNVASLLKKGHLVIIESTISPRLTETMVKPLLEMSGLKAGEDFFLAYCPERVMMGSIIYELENNARIIGGYNEASAQKAQALYKIFVKGEIYLTDLLTAEICKLTENIYRDVNIALANDLAMICEELGCNVWKVVEFANKHPRVHMHLPGPGVGGHCLAVDPWYLIEHVDGNAKLIRNAREINDQMPQFVADKVRKILPEGGKVVILGVAFKADVDDLRESPILHLIENLKQDFEVRVVDPHIEAYNLDIYDTVKDTNLLLLGVNHSIFNTYDMENICARMKQKNILDTRNFYDSKKLEALGFKVCKLGVK
ncbi:MAG: nucleotide sugar dehydrogenase [Hyphomonadaceae bacterium]|nr:nucleotide sugar dehydrogenase [Clostridia bacterium]